MAQKNWLIRTKNKQILGPATKQKIIELIEKGSLTGEDEITSGNGYWFWIREEELLEKYIYGDIKQSFNPISEAPDVLTAGGRFAPIDPFLGSEKPTPKAKEIPAPKPPQSDDVIYPDSSDLEYPDMGEMLAGRDTENFEQAEVMEVENDEAEDITRLDLSNLSSQIEQMKAEGQGQMLEDEQEDAEHFPSDDDLEYPDMGDMEIPEVEEDIDLEIDELEPEVEVATQSVQRELPTPKLPSKKKKVTASKRKTSKVKSKKRKASFTVDDEDEESEFNEDTEDNIKVALPMKQRNDKYLFFILILIVLLIFALFYYYKMVLNKPLPLVGISSAHAQTLSTLGKKKAFLNFKI